MGLISRTLYCFSLLITVLLVVPYELGAALLDAGRVDGELVATSSAVGQADPHQLRPELMPGVLPGRLSCTQTERLASTTGFTEINNLVIFIRFAGEAEYGSNKWRYNRIFNTTPEGSISVKSYFREVSYDQLTIDSHLFPTPAENGKISSYQDTHDRRYYQYGSVNNPNGYQGDAAERELELFQRAVAAVADQVPSSLELDSNDDGYVDSVTFVIKDFPGGASILIPHHSTLASAVTINGLPVAEYSVVFDKALDADVICHQLMHLFGVPDLYRYSYCDDEVEWGLPVGPWDIMSSWQSQPPQPSAYIKHRYTGWIDSIPEITTSGTYTLNPLTSPTNNAFKIASPNSDWEYFVLEYRQKSTASAVDSDLPGSGLLVYRINPQGTNACGPPDEVYLMRPGESIEGGGEIFSAHLSADVGRTELTDTSNPAATLSGGGSAGLSITDIGAAGETISFTVEIQQPCQIGSFSLVSPFPDEQIFGSQATLEWSVADGADSYQVYLGAEQDAVYYADTSLYASTSDNTLTADLGHGAYYWKVLASNGECSNITTPAETRRFILTPEPEQIELGDTIAGLSGDAGSWRYYTVEVPEYMWQLKVNATVDAGEISLHLQYDKPPDVTRSSIHCHPDGISSDWWCQYEDPLAGLWHLAVNAVTDYSGVDLQVSIDPIPPASRNMFGFYPFLVPIAAHSDGLDDSSWVSDLTILNLGAPAIADLYFLRKNHDSSQAAGIRMQLPQDSVHQLADVVRETFGLQQGSGAVMIRSNGDLVVSSRTYNDHASGTYGQYVPGVKEWDMVVPNREVRLIQLTRNADFRTNLGIASTSSRQITVEVGLYLADGTLIDVRKIRVEPYSMRMVTDVFATDVEDGYITARHPTSGFYCFASVVDTHTGDAMLVTPVKAARFVAVVPASINAPGVGGVQWRTDLELHNPGADLLVADIVLLRDTVDGSPAPATQVEVSAGQSLRLSNALATLFGYTGSAALRIAPTTPGELIVTSRTYTQSNDDGGTYGQLVPGVPWQSCTTAGGRVYLTQLQQSDDPGSGFRTNLGFVNPDSDSVQVEVDLWGEVTYLDGSKAEPGRIGTQLLTLAPLSHYQLNRIYTTHTAGRVRNGYAVVRARDGDGCFMAYASMVDNLTADPLFIPGKQP